MGISRTTLLHQSLRVVSETAIAYIIQGVDNPQCPHTREWFNEQFGSAFKPDVTREQFMSAISRRPEDYN